MSIRAIAKELGTDPKTVRRVLRPEAKAKERKPSLLDPFRPLIRKLVLEEIGAVGYRGDYTILKEYIRGFRPKSRRRRVLHLNESWSAYRERKGPPSPCS